jgi:hypothetical protein
VATPAWAEGAISASSKLAGASDPNKLWPTRTTVAVAASSAAPPSDAAGSPAAALMPGALACPASTALLPFDGKLTAG